MKMLLLEMLDGSFVTVTPEIQAPFITDHGRFMSRNGGIETPEGFIPFHAIKRMKFYEEQPVIAESCTLSPSFPIRDTDDKSLADCKRRNLSANFEGVPYVPPPLDENKVMAAVKSATRKSRQR